MRRGEREMEMSEKAKKLAKELCNFFDNDIIKTLQRIKKEDTEGRYEKNWDNLVESEVLDYWIDALTVLENHMRFHDVVGDFFLEKL